MPKRDTEPPNTVERAKVAKVEGLKTSPIVLSSSDTDDDDRASPAPVPWWEGKLDHKYDHHWWSFVDKETLAELNKLRYEERSLRVAIKSKLEKGDFDFPRKRLLSLQDRMSAMREAERKRVLGMYVNKHHAKLLSQIESTTRALVEQERDYARFGMAPVERVMHEIVAAAAGDDAFLRYVGKPKKVQRAFFILEATGVLQLTGGIVHLYPEPE